MPCHLSPSSECVLLHSAVAFGIPKSSPCIRQSVVRSTPSASAASPTFKISSAMSSSTKKPPRGRLLLASGLSPVVSRQRLEPWRYAGSGLFGCPLHRLGPRRGLEASEGGGGRLIQNVANRKQPTSIGAIVAWQKCLSYLLQMRRQGIALGFHLQHPLRCFAEHKVGVSVQLCGDALGQLSIAFFPWVPHHIG